MKTPKMEPGKKPRVEQQLMENDLQSYSPTVLAYIGDAVFELLVRTRLAKNRHQRINTLHNMTVSYVNAENQARIVRDIYGYLTEEEKDLIRRGRNTKGAGPKNADPGAYRLSTGFEALLGYLYLKGDEERLYELVEKAILLK